MKSIKLSFFILLTLFYVPLVSAKAGPAIGVARFEYNGPVSEAYLAGAAQDAVTGALLQQGYAAHPVPKDIPLEKLRSVKQGEKEDIILVVGRIHSVGQRYRVWVKWVDLQGKISEQYLAPQSLNDLLPGLENFAATQLRPVAVAESVPLEPPVQKQIQYVPKALEKEIKKQEALAKQKPEVVASSSSPSSSSGDSISTSSASLPAQSSAASPAVSTKSAKKKRQELPLHDYIFVSERLPFEVRGMAYGDVTGDGHPEILLTSQRKLYLYRWEAGKLELMTEFSGGSRDYFVKVEILPHPEGNKIVLTNLAGDQASSYILKYQGGQLLPELTGIPFQMRVVVGPSGSVLLGAPFLADSDRALQNIFRLSWEGGKIKPVEKLDLPDRANLYNYAWLTEGDYNRAPVMAMSDSGRLRYFEWKDGKYNKGITASDTYGGTANYVPVEMKDVFNEVVADYYGIPVGLDPLIREGQGNYEVVVAKNYSLVKNVIGRIPIISNGQVFRLKWDDLGFVEVWASKRVDGSIQDTLITRGSEGDRLWVALRLRDPGLTGDTGPHDSVLLAYALD